MTGNTLYAQKVQKYLFSTQIPPIRVSNVVNNLYYIRIIYLKFLTTFFTIPPYICVQPNAFLENHAYNHFVQGVL